MKISKQSKEAKSRIRQIQAYTDKMKADMMKTEKKLRELMQKKDTLEMVNRKLDNVGRR